MIKDVPLLCLDIDGTVRHGVDELGYFVNKPDDVVIFPEAIEMMKRWRVGGGRVLGVSNQGGVALGHFSFDTAMETMNRTNELTGRLFDEILWCIHHPRATDPVQSRCWCRKPSPGLIVQGQITLCTSFDERYPSYMGLMVGDRPEDEECARLAGFDFMSAAEWRSQATGQSV